MCVGLTAVGGGAVAAGATLPKRQPNALPRSPLPRRPSCTVFPNTTTFGDPCFGTVKELVAVLTCTSGGGSVIASYPAPVPNAPYTAAVAADWTSLGKKMNVVSAPCCFPSP